MNTIEDSGAPIVMSRGALNS